MAASATKLNQALQLLSRTTAPSSVAPASTVPDTKTDFDVDDISEVELALLMLRKPTELKKVIDSVPKPIRAVPKNGLPKWYKLGLENKLPLPTVPPGKIIFSRGKIGEDIRRVGLGADCPRPSFDLYDPNCYHVSYDYDSMHDPHLAHHFMQKPAKKRMIELGFVTKDGRAICSLKEFNQYRKYLYNRFMDRIHVEMKKLDERARDDLTLKKVAADVARRATIFNKAEKTREKLERHRQINADEIAEKKRLAKLQEQKIQARMKYLDEYKEKQRKDRVIKSQEQEARIKLRITAAAEMELRRKITMIRQWRQNEKRRLKRQKADREAKERQKIEEENRKWNKRIETQNQKIQEEALLLKLYSEDMASAAHRRIRRAENYAYNHELKLQNIKLANWKALHGGRAKAARLVRKMGHEFEKSKRGAKGMSPDIAQRMAAEAMSNALSTKGDPLMILGQARARMDMETILPTAPIRILDQMLETAVVEFARRRVHLLLRDVENVVRDRALDVIFNRKTSLVPRRTTKHPPRLSVQVTSALTHQFAEVHGPTIAFGGIEHIKRDENEEEELGPLKSVRNRPPTPVPSLTKLAEVTFTDKVEDLPDPVTVGTYLPERKKLLENVNTSAKLLSRSVSARVQKGLDLVVGKVILPRLRAKMEWGEAVEALADAVVNNRVHSDCADVRRTSEYLAYRVLQALRREMINEKARQKSIVAAMTGGITFVEPTQQDFYTPGQEDSTEKVPVETEAHT